VTLADFSVAAPLFYAEKAELPLTSYPHIREWFGRVSSLPAWRDTAPAAAAAMARRRRAPSPLQATAQTRHSLTLFFHRADKKFPGAVVALDRRGQGREATLR
jgi:hypothetical protein